MEKLDFLVVADMFMTPTAQLADVVLPASTFLEQTYYATYEGSGYAFPTTPGRVMLRPAVVPPLAESWPDWKIIFELGRRLGYVEDFPWNDIEEAIDDELKPTGITVRDLRAHPEGIQVQGPPILYQLFGSKGFAGKVLIRALNRTLFRKYPRMYHKYRKLGFMTPSKKVELMSEKLVQLGLGGLPDYHEPTESPLGNPELAESFPLVLTTGAKLPLYVHSQFRTIPSLARHMQRNLAEVHTDTARQFGIDDGDLMFVESPRGRIECRAKVTSDSLPRVVQVFPGFEDANANVLTGDMAFDPITGSVPMRSCLCRIGKVLSDAEGEAA